MTLVKLHDDSFIRFYRGFAFLVNQRTKVSHLFNEREQVYLRPISRYPHSVDDQLRSLESALPSIPRAELRRNFIKLVNILDSERFIVTGKSVGELATKSADLYSHPVYPVSKKTIGIPMDAGRFCSSYFHYNPTIFAMQMDLTSACNERCMHCYYPPGQESATLETELALDVLDQLPEQGTLSITFSGGEPFLHSRIGEILMRARRNDLTITIQTNATLLNAETVAMLREVNVNTVQISMYSMVEQDHDAVTLVPGSQKKTMAAIELLMAAGVPIYLSTHIMKPNRNSYKTVLQWGIEHRVKVVTDFIMLARTDFSTENLANRLTIEENEAVIREMLAYGKEFEKGADGRPQIDPQQFADRPICGVATDSISLSSWGEYYPCSGFIGYTVGNARTESLADVWHSSPKLQHLREIRWSHFPRCLSCDAFQYCSMCLARNFNENNGNLYQPVQQNCDVSFLNRRMIEEYWLHGGERL